MGRNREFGVNSGLPDWKLPNDLRRFKHLTEGQIVVMGRKTFESFPPKYRPLPNRKNVVLTRDTTWKHEDVETFRKIEDILENFKNEEVVWIIGGAEIYKQFLDLADELHITKVNGNFPADTFFPEFDESKYRVVHSEKFPKDDRNSHDTEYLIFEKTGK